MQITIVMMMMMILVMMNFDAYLLLSHHKVVTLDAVTITF